MSSANKPEDSGEKVQHTGLPAGRTAWGQAGIWGALQGGRQGAGELLWGNADRGGKAGSRGRSGRKARVSTGRGKVHSWVSGKITATWPFLVWWMKTQDTKPFFNIVYAYETTLFLLVLGE